MSISHVLEIAGWKESSTLVDCADGYLRRGRGTCATSCGYCCGDRSQVRLWVDPIFARRGHERAILLQPSYPTLTETMELTDWCREFWVWFEISSHPTDKDAVLITLTTNTELFVGDHPLGSFDAWLAERRFSRDLEQVGDLARRVTEEKDWPGGWPEEQQVAYLERVIPRDDRVTLNAYVHARKRYNTWRSRYPD